MHSFRLTLQQLLGLVPLRSLVASVALGALLVGCGSEDQAPPYIDPGDGQDVHGAAGSGGQSSDGPDETPDEPPPRVAGVVNVERADCEPAAGALELADPASGRPAVQHLFAGLGGWLAETSYESGFLRLSSDGTEVEQDLLRAGDLDRLTLLGNKALVISANDDGMIWAPYDLENGLGAPEQVFEGPVFQLVVGQSGSRALAVWADYTVVRAQLFDPNGPRGESFELLSGIVTDAFHAAISASGDGFTVAWSTRRLSDSFFESRVVTVSNGGKVGPVQVLYETMQRHQVIDLVPSNTGLSLLFDDDGAALIAPLDKKGHPRADARRFGDARGTYALGADGARLLLGARLGDGRDALRLLDENGTPREDVWRCLQDAPSNEEHAVAIGQDDAGFGVLFRDELGKNRFLRVDAD